jgi:hypothetical protein
MIPIVVLMMGFGEAEELVAIGGMGSQSCGTWTAGRRDRQALGSEQWILGFLSGIGYVSLVPNGTNPLEGTDAKGVWAWVDNYCQTHPLDPIITAGIKFVGAHPH